MTYCLVTKEHLKKQGKLSVHCKRSGSSVVTTLQRAGQRGPDALDENIYNI